MIWVLREYPEIDPIILSGKYSKQVNILAGKYSKQVNILVLDR
jgi:hypothetical protein